MAESKQAVVLKADDANTVADQVFGDFPGVYTPGKPVPLEEIGLDADQARRLIQERGLPLEVTTGGRKTSLKTAAEHLAEHKPKPGEAFPMLPPGGKIASSPVLPGVEAEDVPAVAVVVKEGDMPATAAEHDQQIQAGQDRARGT